MADVDKRTKIVFGGRRQGKSLVMKEYQMTIFKEAMRKAWKAGFECSETRDFVFTGSDDASFEKFYAEFEADIRNGPRSHAKHDTHMQVVGRALRETSPVAVHNYSLQAMAAEYLTQPEDIIRKLVDADYADVEANYIARMDALPPNEFKALYMCEPLPSDAPFKGLAEVEREITAAFGVPKHMLGGDYVPGVVGVRTGRFSSKDPNFSAPPRVAMDFGTEPPVATVTGPFRTLNEIREALDLPPVEDTRDVSDAQDAEAVADEWRNNDE